MLVVFVCVWDSLTKMKFNSTLNFIHSNFLANVYAYHSCVLLLCRREGDGKTLAALKAKRAAAREARAKAVGSVEARTKVEATNDKFNPAPFAFFTPNMRNKRGSISMVSFYQHWTQTGYTIPAIYMVIVRWHIWLFSQVMVCFWSFAQQTKTSSMVYNTARKWRTYVWASYGWRMCSSFRITT